MLLKAKQYKNIEFKKLALSKEDTQQEHKKQNPESRWILKLILVFQKV